MRRLGGLIALALLAACGGGDDGGGSQGLRQEAVELADDLENAPPCREMFAPGRPLDDVLADTEDPGVCREGEEHIYTALPSFPCTQDPTRAVHYNSYGWGIDGGTWATLPAGQDAPSADVC